MESMWMLYWLTRVITIKSVAGPMWFISCCLIVFAGLAIWVCRVDSYTDKISKLFPPVMKLGFTMWAVFGLAYILCPTKEEAAVIVAGGAVVEAAKSETAQRLASKSVTILENSLDNILGKQALEKATKETK